MTPDKTFEAELLATQYVHAPLPLHRERALEADYPNKKVLADRPLWPGGGLPFAAARQGSVERLRLAEGEALRLAGSLRSDRWPEDGPQDGDYIPFGHAELAFTIPAESWEGYNRVAFRVFAGTPGGRIAHLYVALVNEGEIAVPDVYHRTGSTLMDLVPNAWNDCWWEFPTLPRDKVTRLRFYVYLAGADYAAGPGIAYNFMDIRLQKVDAPDKELGWGCEAGHIALSTLGYWPRGRKTALAPAGVADFALYPVKPAAAGEPAGEGKPGAAAAAVFTGAATAAENDLGSFSLLDFSAFEAPGRYVLRAGGLVSPPFSIDEDILREPLWKAVNFLFCQRCGAPVPCRHTACHLDMLGEHEGLRVPYAGGWHDAGDLSQQTAQTGEVTHALFEAAMRVKARGGDNQLYLRLMEEAQWGLDFVLRTRFGDGTRATSAGSVRWTNGLAGDFDDLDVRVHGHAFENFLLAGVEAFAARALAGHDPGYAQGCLRVAVEDFGFARARWASHGMELPNIYEHTTNSGPSQYYACMVWAAAEITLAGGGEEYARWALPWAEKLLACQETGAAGIGISGYFYRDTDHKAIVHYSHQSREQQFVQALQALCLALPAHPDKAKWEKALRLYGGYIKSLAAYTAPWGMLPAGVYRRDELEDRETYALLHIFADFERERDNYTAQLNAGVQLDAMHVLRRFPVWFSFRGNLAIQLAMGKGAALVGRYFGDEALLEIGREQLYWVFGKNPFAQSLMTGVGSRYPALYATLPGESAGALPVGIQTLGNGDEPHWPIGNIATYKEVWTTSAGRWLWLAADLL